MIDNEHGCAGLETACDGRANARGRRLPSQAMDEANLFWATSQADCFAGGVLIEPINTRNVQGLFLNRPGGAHSIAQKVDAPILIGQSDQFHCQNIESDLVQQVPYVPAQKARRPYSSLRGSRTACDLSWRVELSLLVLGDRHAGTAIQIDRLGWVRIPAGTGCHRRSYCQVLGVGDHAGR